VQASTPLPEHRVEPGVQTPVHAPLEHAEETQGVGFTHAPLVEHVSTLFPEHRIAFGVHVPVQVPPTQA
jgi:hypothetical protein